MQFPNRLRHSIGPLWGEEREEGGRRWGVKRDRPVEDEHEEGPGEDGIEEKGREREIPNTSQITR